MTKNLLFEYTEQQAYLMATLPYLVIRSHHVQGGINFDANDEAQRTLSREAFCLYAHLIKKGWYDGEILFTDRIEENTHLTPEEQMKAINELLKTGYLTNSPVFVKTAPHVRNTFHIWEEPSLVKRDEGRAAMGKTAC